MSATTTARPYTSGFCAVGNPQASHRRCPGGHNANPTRTWRPCSCTCHTEPAPIAAEPALDAAPQTPAPAALREEAAGSGPELDARRAGLYVDLAEPAYLGDTHSISASGAKRLLKSPAHYRLPSQATEATDLGSAFHTEVLGAGQEVVVVDAASWRGKEAQEVQAAARAGGKAPILAKDLPTVQAMAAAVRKHPTAARLLSSPGRPEVSAFWLDPAWDVTRRCRVDWLTDNGINVDLKSAASIDRHKVQRAVIDYGYDLSAAWYEDVLTGLGVDLRATAFVFVEKTEPYRVRVVELDPDFIARGRQLAARALEIHRDCLAADLWPAWDDPDFTTIHPPAWAREDLP